MIKKTFILSLSEDLRNQVKASAALKSMTMIEWITAAINEKLKREQKQ